MIQLVQAIAYLHKMGFFHRDLSMENIFINKCKQIQMKMIPTRKLNKMIINKVKP